MGPIQGVAAMERRGAEQEASTDGDGRRNGFAWNFQVGAVGACPSPAAFLHTT